jgi:serine/threonine protein phosphatase PrpC
LWDVLTGQHAYEIIKDLTSAEEMASSLLKTALKSSKCTDNVTVIVIKL